MMLAGWQPDVSLPVDTHVPQSKYEKNMPLGDKHDARRFRVFITFHTFRHIP